jgi:hypothetical protein
MTRSAPDLPAGTTRLLVDGTNLLHALARGPDPLPPVALTGRLRSLVPPGVHVVLVLDGSPASGAAERRLTAGVEVRYSGRRPADVLLAELAAAGPAGTLVVTDDHDLGVALRRQGARTVRAGWLAERLARQRLQAPAVGHPKPPPVAAAEGHGDEEPGRRWRPGRGATRKTGNPKRGRRPA